MEPPGKLMRLTTQRVLVCSSICVALASPRHSSTQSASTRHFRSAGSGSQVSVDKTATMRIVGGSGACVFNRVSAMLRSSSGHIVLLNGGEQQVCEFTPSGTLVAVHGRKGSGPGEFVFPTGLYRVGQDTIVVYDEGQRRFSILDRHGKYVRSFRLDLMNAPSEVVTSVLGLADGRILVGLSDVVHADPSPSPRQFTQSLYLISTTGRQLRSIGQFRATEHFVQAVPPQFGRIAYWERAFGRRTGFAAVPNGFVAGDASSFLLQRFGSDGKPAEQWTSDSKTRLVTDRDIAKYKLAELVDVKPQRQEIERRRLDEMPYPASFPAFRRLFADPMGNIWFEPFALPGTSASTPPLWKHWDASEGRELEVTMPVGLRVLEVSTDLVCGVVRDEDDLESIACYRISRRPPPKAARNERLPQR